MTEKRIKGGTIGKDRYQNTQTKSPPRITSAVAPLPPPYIPTHPLSASFAMIQSTSPSFTASNTLITVLEFRSLAPISLAPRGGSWRAADNAVALSPESMEDTADARV